MRFVASLLVALLLSAPHVARADDANKAMALFHKSAEAYQAGHFEDAITLLKEAYALKQEPVLLFNLARAYEGVGDLKHAVESYRGYLNASPHAEDRGAVEQRITTLDREIAEHDSLEKQTPPPTQPKTKERVSLAPAQWIVAGAGGVAIATGAIFGGLSLSSHAAASGDSQVGAQNDQSRAHTDATIANVCFVGGAVIVVVAVVLEVLDVRASSRTTASISGMTLSW